MLACVPLTFALDLDPGAVRCPAGYCAAMPERGSAGVASPASLDEGSSRPTSSGPSRRMCHSPAGQRAAQGAEIRHIPVQADQPQQTFDEPCRLPQRHAEKNLHRQTNLDGGVAVDGLSPTLAGKLCRPNHVRIKPDIQRPAALERLVIRGPVQRLVGRCVLSAHPPQLSRWIHKMNPSRDLCNRARER